MSSTAGSTFTRRLLQGLTAEPSTRGSAAAWRWIWGLIGVLTVVYAAAFVLLDLQSDPWELVIVTSVSATLLAGSAVYGTIRPDERLARLLRGAVELLLLSLLCGKLSYAASSLGMPLWDQTFLEWDQALGFDWRYWLGVVDAYPRVHLVLAFAYDSMLPQFMLLLLALAACRAFDTMDRFLLSYGVTAAVTVTIAACMPALSPLIHLGITAADHPNIVLAVPLAFAEQIEALRQGTLRLIDISGSHGLVTFPSFHTVGAVLLMMGWSRVPVLRWPGLALNVVMLVSIPIEGSHYLVDVLAGAALAVAAWLGAGILLERAGRPAAPDARAIRAPAHPSLV